MTQDQAGVAAMLLNTYAHNYLGIGRNEVIVAAGGHHDDPASWQLIIANRLDGKAAGAADFDEGKAIIDGLRKRLAS